MPKQDQESTHWQSAQVYELIDQLLEVRKTMLQAETRFQSEISLITTQNQASAKNLLHYVALRRHDIRPLQEQLVAYGLSSLGRCESHVLANIDAVLDILTTLSRRACNFEPMIDQTIDFAQGRACVERNTEALFGQKAQDRGAHIMVTMPSEASTDYELIRDLVVAGMTSMRINCAHDDERVWAGMIANVRKVEQEVGRSCQIIMDLAGPKIRTGPIEPGPRVIRWRPRRNSYGQVVVPARIWLAIGSNDFPPPSPADASVHLHADWSQVDPGDTIIFRDARDRERTLTVTGVADGGLWCEADRTAYVTPDLVMQWKSAKRSDDRKGKGRVAEICATEQVLTLYQGDRLMITDASKPGYPARYDDRGKLVSRASIGCTLPEIFRNVRCGERILFDDGKIGGVIEEVHSNHLIVEITRARANGEKLAGDKGINLPDSALHLPALTEKDLQDLAFVAENADAVSYSFVRNSEDVYHLQEELKRLGRPDLGIVLKIENQQAVQRLARLLLAVMRSPISGVMIARGDLAVECGWQRLAEVQEEILWMCEAAHMPVIWATQVLESLAKKGLPSRSEITDAAMGVRAECVMLNKGPNIVATVRALVDILRRMQDHQVKKRPMLRKLSLADDLLPAEE